MRKAPISTTTCNPVTQEVTVAVAVMAINLPHHHLLAMKAVIHQGLVRIPHLIH